MVALKKTSAKTAAFLEVLKLSSFTQNTEQEELSFLSSVLKTCLLNAKLQGIHPSAEGWKATFIMPEVSFELSYVLPEQLNLWKSDALRDGRITPPLLHL